MPGSLNILLISTISIAFLHSLAPDHWMPFVAIAKVQKWTKFKLLSVTFLCGLAHVGVSIAVSVIGILLGFSLSKLRGLEGNRAEISLWLLIGFGIAYMIWGIKKAKEHSHSHNGIHHHKDLTQERLKAKTIAIWTLFTIFILGPCESLIPLAFLGYNFGYFGVISVSVVFSIVTILMMLAQSLLAFKGIQLIKGNLAERYAHAFAGLVIALTGILVMVLGI